ncbi:hypothetical protein VOLCADRAFT_119814 [Volvox carteri f. nagariensis]|uniref:Uncharacterized protein n=1 Tax=Volvox carteri f. nagariensis TaxID=3068 RepID=D8UH47_VOLCA|nr:uncharacterized protein VOLCADRAFT_119814 [Volvox carteri f. nagariensis]EFJ40914.1 hypothetical protein VOLCADRAFT_119814 [Volvox carteri f. nagariensis]|eukprot:XP_002957981.1 hypothetical protein VOLCADRAFT_119814 [Volvox carteri f. nagariensis]
MNNITQSVKKMNRIIRLVRGLSYEDAVAQCKMVPHKAARYVLQTLEAAYQDATQAVGLNGERLVVGGPSGVPAAPIHLLPYAASGSPYEGHDRELGASGALAHEEEWYIGGGASGMASSTATLCLPGRGVEEYNI